jgi:hypothetical protein
MSTVQHTACGPHRAACLRHGGVPCGTLGKLVRQHAHSIAKKYLTYASPSSLLCPAVITLLLLCPVGDLPHVPGQL